MQKAITADQAIIHNEDGTNVSYSDHEEIIIDKESERIALLIQDASTTEQLDELFPNIKEQQKELFEQKKTELINYELNPSKKGR